MLEAKKGGDLDYDKVRKNYQKNFDELIENITESTDTQIQKKQVEKYSKVIDHNKDEW